MGVFASRSPFRPNSLGLSVVKLEGLEKTAENGTALIVSGIDMLNGTPIYDIKPYLPYADRAVDAIGGYGEENSGYRLNVNFPDELLELIPLEKRESLKACLAEDPRPAYQAKSGRAYTMYFAGFDVQFRVREKRLTVVSVKKRS